MVIITLLTAFCSGESTQDLLDGNFSTGGIPDAKFSFDIENDIIALSESNSTSFTYQMSLRFRPKGEVVVSFVQNGQLTLSKQSLVFTADNFREPQTVVVTAVDDSLAEGTHAALIEHQASIASLGLNRVYESVTAVITDNDSASVNLVESSGSTAVVEGGATDTYTVVLSSPPTSDVTLSAAHDAQITLNGNTGTLNLTFTPANYNVAQTVTVAAVDDTAAEGPNSSTSTINHTASSADSLFNNLTIAHVTVTVSDNDTVAIFAGGLTQGNMGGRSGADTQCETAKTNNHSSFTCTNVHAMLSFSATDEIRDLNSTYSLPPANKFVSPNGTQVASSFADFLDNSISTSFASAGILPISTVYVTLSTNTGGLATNNCSGGTSNSGLSSQGITNFTFGYLGGTNSNCVNSAQILCLCW